MTEKELKQLVGKALGTRSPRTLNIFYAFYRAYTSSMKRQEQDTISNTLTAWLSTKTLQQKFGLNQNSYKKYFEAFVAEMSEGYVSGYQSRIITRWTDNWMELMEAVGTDLRLPSEFYRKFYDKTVDMTDVQREAIRKLMNKTSNKTISNTLRESLDMGFFYSTDDSPFRIYNALQNISKTERRQLFAGNYDVDIESCFSAIAWNILDMKNCDLDYAYLLNPAFKLTLREKIMKELDCDLTKAKSVVQYLFTNRTDCTMNISWLNRLHREINDRVRAQFNDTINTHHKFFTYHEQQIIEKYVAEQGLVVVLPIHDGFITTAQPQHLEVSYLGHNFQFSCDKFELVSENAENASEDTLTDCTVKHTDTNTERVDLRSTDLEINDFDELMNMFEDWEKQHETRSMETNPILSHSRT